MLKRGVTMIETLNGIKETVNFKEINGFKLYDNTDFEAYPAHWHTQLEILMPIENTYEVTCKNELFTLEEGDILLINSGVIHSMSALAGERLIFQADLSLLHNVAGIELTLSTIPSVLLLTKANSPAIHDRLHALMLEIRREYFSNAILVSASIYSKLIEMLVLVGRQNTAAGNVFDATQAKKKEYTEKFIYVCNYIQLHCTEDLSLDDAAALAGFSKYHFTRLFKNFTGLSFYRYLNKKRIEHAEQLLVDPKISITEVALQSGFSSLSAFIRMFKLLKECTPTEFRNTYDA